MRKSLLLIFSLLFAAPLHAQFYNTQYRLPDQNWQEIRSEQFRVIYPARYESEAIRTLSILEKESSDIRELVGGELRHFPFILNPENDRSNGFVSPMNFRSEVEIAPIKGKALNPQSGDWLESVVPHELVHALHFSVNPPSFTRALGLLSPDIRRSVHAAAPLGVLEGIAVEYESHGSIPHSGRGHHPYFTNQFNALLNTDEEWSMGQLVHISDFSLPFNRHYVGGYELTHWVLDEYGDDAMKKAIDFHYKYPFLGFGTALRSATGKWPRSLYREFSRDVKEREERRLSEIENETDTVSEELSIAGKCRRANRPIWMDETSLIYYGRFCNQEPGFYLYDTETDQSRLIHEVTLSQDQHYTISPDRTRLLYSRYNIDPFFDNVFRGDVYELEIASGSVERLTNDSRLFSPAYFGTEFLALDNRGQHLGMIRAERSSGIELARYEMPEDFSVVMIAINPVNSGKKALIGKKNGVQAVWVENDGLPSKLFDRNPDIVFTGGSVYDLYWHPDGERFLFVSDHTGTMNVYEYSTDEESVTRITNSLYNAFEPSYSPDGESITYVQQKQTEQLLYTMPVNHAEGSKLSDEEWRFSQTISGRMNRPLMNRDEEIDTENWEFSRYRTGLSWLKPRLWMPMFEQTNTDASTIGVQLESVDLMSRQAYGIELSHYRDRFWFDAEYRYKGYYPGFLVNVFDRPSLANFNVTQNGERSVITFLQQSRGASLKIPMTLRLENNPRTTSFLFEPQYFINQTRYLDPFRSSNALSEYATRHTVGLRTVFNLRLRQFFRDVQPNSGWVFFTEGRYGLNEAPFQINLEGSQLAGNLAKRRGLRAGATTYLAPLSRWNQSLRITAQAITQSDVPVFNTTSLISNIFSDVPLAEMGTNNTGVLDTRYTIPLTYPDDGGLLLPVYLSNIYLVLFSQTVADLDRSDLVPGSRSVFGAGIRSRFRLSNLAFDVGISIGWEPTRNNVTWQAGSF
ncbi:MAG: hypothetical protein LAT80_05600 [Balneolaceae bacterium]|nr:hypothetical protein [Balneolaceae bacterium]